MRKIETAATAGDVGKATLKRQAKAYVAVCKYITEEGLEALDELVKTEGRKKSIVQTALKRLGRKPLKAKVDLTYPSKTRFVGPSSGFTKEATGFQARLAGGLTGTFNKNYTASVQLIAGGSADGKSLRQYLMLDPGAGGTAIYIDCNKGLKTSLVKPAHIKNFVRRILRNTV